MNEVNPWLLHHGLKIVLYIFGAYLLRFIARRFIANLIRISVKQDERNPTAHDEQLREDTLIRVCVLVMNFALVGLVVMMSLQEMGIPIGPMLAGAGIFGIALGFGGQYLVRDIISGFFIIFENQYRIGDIVNFDGTSGKVEDIGLRITTLRDMDGTVHHVPHGEIKRVANYSKSFARVNLDIPITYSSNLDQVIATVNRVGLEMAEDLKWKDMITKAPQFLRVDDFTDTAILVKIAGETQSLKQWQVTRELRKRLKEAFDKEGIEMPVHDRQLRKSEPPLSKT